ncbi:MAG: serine hydrolase [Cyanobacteria bacterium]|nr:serine hydrolase [Cyanobacteriota bacterium]
MAKASLAEQLSGRILIQVKSYGRAWYVSPVDKKRYYLRDGNAAYELMKKLGLGITKNNLDKIPSKKGQKGDRALINRVKGNILIDVENHGEAWYVNPNDGLRYYLKDGKSAYELMKKFGLGITNENLKNIPMNDSQIAFDATFSTVAHVKYNGINFSYAYYADTILPLASLTKLMTALVILDLNPDWNKIVTIQAEQINYPKNYVDQEMTSEVELRVGDKMTFYDLWVAMLTASSNQATISLVDATGLSRQEFIKLMNEKATNLNLTKTEFFDPSGLDPHNLTTPKEMAIISKTAFDKPKIAETTLIRDYNIAAIDINGATKTINVINRNYSLFDFNPSGVKTGFLIEAQRNVVLKKDNDILVVMHALSMKQRNNIIKKMID